MKDSNISAGEEKKIAVLPPVRVSPRQWQAVMAQIQASGLKTYARWIRALIQKSH